MTQTEALAFVEAQAWHFAKTMPQWPHWYCLVQEASDRPGFYAFVRHIQEAGYLAEFRPELREAWATRRYLDLGLHYYWTMDPVVEKTTLINRARHPNAAVRN